MTKIFLHIMKYEYEYYLFGITKHYENSSFIFVRYFTHLILSVTTKSLI